MKIILTGGKYGLGKSIDSTLKEAGYSTYALNSIDSYNHYLPSIIDDYDVFINNQYKDRVQTKLFEFVYSQWKYKNKTIVNILTSALVFGGPNKKYIDDKQNLEDITFKLRTSDKKVRVINIYPNTLETTKDAPTQKLNLNDVSEVIKTCIELPQYLELFQVGISKTTLNINSTMI